MLKLKTIGRKTAQGNRKVTCIRSIGGATLIEVLVAIVITSFGLLSIAAFLAYGTQLPKLAGYRAAASLIAQSYIERMRANVGAFQAGSYDENLSYDGSFSVPSLNDCQYTDPCNPQTIAAMDKARTQQQLRMELPGGGMRLERDTSTGLSDGNLWIFWREPNAFAGFDPVGSDNCPPQVAAYDPAPRCLYFRFKL